MDKRGNVRINRTVGLIHITIFTVEKQETLHILSVSVALVINHAKRTPC